MNISERFKQPNQIAILIDPEKCQSEVVIRNLVEKIHFSGVDFVFVGGSTVSEKEFEQTIGLLKQLITIPLVIFPGSAHQVSEKADGILLLNLISGRNPDYLIGHHVQAAQKIIESKAEVISTSYLLIDGGSHSSVAYVSQTTPIPHNQVSIAYNTALAGKLIGHQALFLDAGSGAKHAVSVSMVIAMKELGQPLIIGGGVKSLEQINTLHKAGANVVVIGNKIEEDIDFLLDIRNYIAEKTDK
ncbi:geranylgeranylglyceryl phosphate synthase family protein [Crocinitomicaceae bacterium CZZ-1]|uniref:Geranylgeranylglyceryl phosphate synthase n=1 Tax=Taishania pollutisoli TaxID=2766479 RepID=A0A8J6PAU7_9FLAO|nr:geranylgeranylglyceryl/heptaprenylglyceryl phosphate synthase [Taishania pollutisoli]MBC9811337.1 geranylgeranylglyceryl phosphate synthase family protein [Taishania pollutisoli]MBX2947748.1 geranylgeranylglyceryl phosphate synthase family protein [Crocinitomicaceae bacterium]